MHGSLKSNLLDSSHCRGVDWIEEVARSLDVKALSDFVMVLWNIWNSRNNKVFGNMEEDAKVTWERAAALSHDFRIFNLLKEPSLPKPAVKKGWRKPNQGMVKINFDVVVKDQKSSFGIIARDHDGFVLGGVLGCLTGTTIRIGLSCTRLRRALILLGIIRGPGWNLSLIVPVW
ncbi:hypothetical protein Gotur_006467 [Gossypium turneri]